MNVVNLDNHLRRFAAAVSAGEAVAPEYIEALTGFVDPVFLSPLGRFTATFR